MILVWLVNPLTGNNAFGADPAGPEKHIQTIWNREKVDFGFQYPGSLKKQPYESSHQKTQFNSSFDDSLIRHDNIASASDDEDQSSADVYLVLKLAFEEFEFFAGVRHLLHRTEKKLEKWAIKLKIKGEISISDQRRRLTHNSSDLALAHDLRPVSKDRIPQSTWLSFLIPKEVKWNLGLDPGAKTAFGELNLGPYLTLKGVVGGEQEATMLFRYEF